MALFFFVIKMEIKFQGNETCTTARSIFSCGISSALEPPKHSSPSPSILPSMSDFDPALIVQPHFNHLEAQMATYVNRTKFLSLKNEFVTEITIPSPEPSYFKFSLCHFEIWGTNGMYWY